MNTVRIKLPRPHAKQSEVIASAKRFNVLDCGRRWGKTELGMDRAVHPALHGKPVGWFAPSYKYLTPVWSELRARLAPVTARKSEQEHKLELMGGGSLEMWSMDTPGAGRSRAYARVIVDEAAMVSDLRDAWEQAIRPTLTDYRGDAWFLSTPKGIAHYFHEIYQRGADPASDEWAAWQMPSSSNPFLHASEIESARGDMTDLAFAQEYLAQFVSWEGSVFRCIDQAVYEPPDPPRGAWLIGVDWGRTHDFTVFVALDPHGNVLAVDRFRGVEYSVQRDRLIAFWHRVSAGRAIIVAEVNSMGGPNVEALMHDGLPVRAFQTTGASKSHIIELLALAFEQRRVHIPNDPVMIGELQAFEGRTLPSGATQYGAPKGENNHDDTVMALAIAWSGYDAAQDNRPSRVWADPNTGYYTDDDPGPVEISPY